MVAPNGARRTTQDHPATPVTDVDLVETARACHAAGASALHAHIRNTDQSHLLDAARYHRLLHTLAESVPDLSVQVTSEAANVYASDQQIEMLDALDAPWISLAVREITRNQSNEALRHFFKRLSARARIQFILYDTSDFETLIALHTDGIVPIRALEVLYVLGRYRDGQQSEPSDIEPFLSFRETLPATLRPTREMVCAFGVRQIDCLVQAAQEGLDTRIGFENGIWLPDGSVAPDNAALVRALVAALNG